MKRMFQLKINGKNRECSAGTVHGLLKQLNIRHEIAIVELNKQIIKKENYSTTTLKPNDSLEIITLVGGG